MKPWTLIVRGNKAFTVPKIAVLRSFVMNHLIHHRAQLGVFLRLNDVKPCRDFTARRRTRKISSVVRHTD